MSYLSSFLRKLSPEYKQLGEGLSTIILGLALPKAERDTVMRVIDTLNNAADSIALSIEKVEEAEKIGVDRAMLKGVIKEMLPDIIGGMSETAIRQMLEAKKKPAKEAVKQAPKARKDDA